MKTLLLAILAVLLSFQIGYSVSKPDFIADEYYYCAAISDSCDPAEGWEKWQEMNAHCCCSTAEGWMHCAAVLEIWSHQDGRHCYRRKSNWIIGDEPCQPGPVASEPIQPADPNAAGCCSAPASPFEGVQTARQ